MSAALALVVKAYPRLSETFVAEEIRALERRGLPLLIVSLRHPAESLRHPVHGEISAPILYLPEYLWREPLRVFRAFRKARVFPGFRAARKIFLRDLGRDPTPGRLRRFGQALVLAAELPRSVRHLHAHFVHTPASVARYAALVRGLSFSLSAHAKDVWTTPAWEIAGKLKASRANFVCSRAAYDRLQAIAPAAPLALAYHGIDLSRLPAPEPRPRAGQILIASVGRLTEKKGYDTLLAALALLPPGLDWRFEHIGGGPLAARLHRKAQTLGLSPRIVWHGARAREDVVALLRRAHVFALASRIAKSGDRDGLPNVLLEALALGAAAVATEVSAIPELIVHERTGLLAPPDDPPAFTAALARLLRDPELRARLAREGRARLERDFSPLPGFARIEAALRAALGEPSGDSHAHQPHRAARAS